MNPYYELANAIVIQAYKDYILFSKQLKRLQKTDTSGMGEKQLKKFEDKLKDAKAEIRSIEKFFYSRWYSCLTSVNPDIIMAKLKQEVAKA